MKVTDKHILFWSDWPSNFAWAPIRVVCLDGQIHTFFSSEQCFMWHKAWYFKDFEILNQIEELPFNDDYSHDAKKLGKKVKGFDSEKWREVCVQVMKLACLAKFSQNMVLFDKITSPEFEGKKFVEASPYDGVWGIKLGEGDPRADDESQWNGENLLGKVLDEVRTELLNGYKAEIKY